MTLQNLANEFGVSVMPVREALWQLQSEKVIVIESNKRVYVNGLTRDEMEEALRLRLMVESMAVERSCERVTDADVARIKQVLISMEASLEKPKRYVLLNSQFHSLIYSYADSPMLLEMIEFLWARVAPYVHMAWEKAGDHAYVMKCHQGMFEALAERDKVKLLKWLHEDLTQAAHTIMPFLGDGKDGVNGEKPARSERPNTNISK